MIHAAWASKWGIPLAAMQELESMVGIAAQPKPDDDAPAGSESRQQSLVRLEASQKNIALFRNNVGALLDARNVPVRFGLANESKQMNQRLKSGDLIGIEPVLIAPWMVGMIIGRFISVEIKEETWHYTGTDHEVAQLANRPGLL